MSEATVRESSHHVLWVGENGRACEPGQAKKVYVSKSYAGSGDGTALFAWPKDAETVKAVRAMLRYAYAQGQADLKRDLKSLLDIEDPDHAD